MSGEDSWVYGFSGAGVRVMGSIQLPYTLGESPLSMTKMLEFKVLNQESSHNVLLGRPFLREMRASYEGFRKDFHSEDASDDDRERSIEQPIEEIRVHYYIEQGDERLSELPPTLLFLEDTIRIEMLEEEEPPYIIIQADGAPSEEVDAPLQGGCAISENRDPPDLHSRIPMPTEKMGPAEDTIEIPVDEKDPSKVLRIGSQLALRLKEGLSIFLLANLDDSFPLPRIDQLVDATAGHALLSFMDAYSGYKQIPMYGPDQEHTSFITNRGLYCYIGMSFGLINTGATYQRLVNKMFKRQIGKTMEVYVDDMRVKSKRAEDHITDLAEMFHILRKYRMKLNPQKSVFGVESGKFLGFMVNH
ncbi:uncharacterized protein LOC141690665 [Apium graveolens]|uniref:uncharacterized protein LOC141690665 n=1 Tax=Apium graveolens TaxID=4045 RepID=UPI003D79A3AF